MLLILAVVLIVFLGAVTLVLNAAGAPMWNADISRNAKLIWGCGFSVALAIAALWLGPAILATWPFWVGTLAFTVAAFVGMDKLFGGKPKAQPSPDVSWDAMWRSFEGKPLPGWMLEAASSGRVTYDGKPAQVVDGRLVAGGGKTDSPSWASRAIKELWG